jgi:hypothetical protein
MSSSLFDAKELAVTTQTNRSSKRPIALSLCAGIALAFTKAFAAPITSAMTGAWYDPARSGQGIQVQIVGQSQKDLLLYWYTYDANGNPLWLIATAPITGDVAKLTALEVRGPRFAVNANPVASQVFGEVELEFNDCNSGVMRFQTRLGTGSFPLTRLSNTFGQSCTGTFIDDRNPVATNQTDGSATTAGVALTSTYREDPGRIRFKVKAKGPMAATGNRYGLYIGNIKRAELVMVASGGESEAEVEFASPAEPGKLTLDFDPRGAALELRLISGNSVGGGTNTPPPSGSGAPPFGNSDQRVAFTVSPSFALGSGTARLRREIDRVRFEVEIEDVPIGSYSVRVDGVHRGTLLVSSQNGKTQGEVEFAFPQDGIKPLLNFDPRGRLVEIRSGSQLVASVMFVN